MAEENHQADAKRRGRDDDHPKSSPLRSGQHQEDWRPENVELFLDA
jgi:hypothetical protein